MAKKASVEEGLSVVFVDQESDRAIVPIGGDDRMVDAPEDSVTVDGVRRAAQRVRDQRHKRPRRDFAAVTVEGSELQADDRSGER